VRKPRRVVSADGEIDVLSICSIISESKMANCVEHPRKESNCARLLQFLPPDRRGGPAVGTSRIGRFGTGRNSRRQGLGGLPSQKAHAGPAGSAFAGQCPCHRDRTPRGQSDTRFQPLGCSDSISSNWLSISFFQWGADLDAYESDGERCLRDGRGVRQTYLARDHSPRSGVPRRWPSILTSKGKDAILRT
jgi:hypothetical protein